MDILAYRIRLFGLVFCLFVVFAGHSVAAEDDVESIRLHAQQGNAVAQLTLGFMYANGQGVSRDDTEAAKWYGMAAEQGHVGAQLSLGIIYANGKGVLEDMIQAYKWLSLAMAQGHEQAVKARDIVARKMSRRQIRKAEKMAREWQPAGEKAVE